MQFFRRGLLEIAIVPLALGIILTAGCGSIPTELADGSVGFADAGTALDQAMTIVPDAGAPDLLPACAADPERPDAGTCVFEVRATVVDEQGQAVPNLLTTVCEAQCYYGRTDDGGATVVAIDDYIPAERYSLVIHGRPRWAGYYALLPKVVAGVSTFAAPVVVAALPATGPMVATDGSAQTLVSGDVTLEVPAGVKVDPDLEDTIDPDGVRFRTLRIPEGAWPPFVKAGAVDAPQLLYALTPYETALSGPAQVTIAVAAADRAALPAGATLDVLGLGSLLWAAGPPAGRWSVIGSAHVSSDGNRVTLDPGAGLDFITWIGIRRRTP